MALFLYPRDGSCQQVREAGGGAQDLFVVRTTCARFGDGDANVEWPAAFVEFARSVVARLTGNAEVAREQVSATWGLVDVEWHLCVPGGTRPRSRRRV